MFQLNIGDWRNNIELLNPREKHIFYSMRIKPSLMYKNIVMDIILSLS